MTMKEIETQSGMTRANIRFYETEGLLAPERRTNRYRDYSENDLEILKRIKLLRTLHISLAEIKTLHTGEQELIDVLNQHLTKLQLEKADIEQSQEICKVIRSDDVQYQTLNAQHYLDAIEQVTHQPVPIPSSDVISNIRAPWRRFFARALDCFIYSVLWGAFLSLVLNVNVSARNTLENFPDGIVALLLMLFLEPALLSLFGTTVGKWLLGLRITDNEGRRMTYGNALARTWTMFFRGMGLNVPIYNLVRLWKSYKACDAGETLDWEYDSTIILKDEKGWRIAAYVGIHAFLIGLLMLTFAIAEMPKNRGDITVAEFSENYNRLAKYYGTDTNSHLNTQGNWVQDESSVNIINVGGYDEPNYIFSETDGIMTGMQFSTELHGSDDLAPGYQNEMILSILAFVRAQEGNGLFSNEVKDIVETISESPFDDFTFSVYGVNITCAVEYSGYIDTASPGMLWPEEGAETSYSLFFSMRKQ